jgi:alpha-tubulin suppressor-like RCC1 family protein
VSSIPLEVFAGSVHSNFGGAAIGKVRWFFLVSLLAWFSAGESRAQVPFTDASQVATGTYHTCALASGGGVKCWGGNSTGQLGDNTTNQKLTAVDVSGLAGGVMAIATGNDHTCALTNSGGVKCWGYNSRGQLGDNSTATRLTPVDVAGLTSGVAAVVTGNAFSCALTNDGGVKCWGYNEFGQLGDNSVIDKLSPVDVSGMASGIVAIAAGGAHVCALTTSGGVKCWGANNFGQLGDNNDTLRQLTVVDVIGLSSGVRAIAAGERHTCALTDSGGVKCWGRNGNGQLGDNSTIQRNTPVNVNGLTAGVSAIATGGHFHTCALVGAGGVKCWGANSSGQLGDGTTTTRQLTPVNVIGMTGGVIAVATGGWHSCAVTAVGGVKCWGHNPNGPLGDGTTVNRLVPVDALQATSPLPGAPVIGVAIPGDASASVAFTAPASGGDSAITGYKATSSPGGFASSGCTASPCVVLGLVNGTAYTFRVTATNSAGTGAPSAASNSVTPAAPQSITFTNPGAQYFGTTPILTATTTSGLPVSFASSTTDVCTVTAGGALTFVIAGSCTITADQSGNGAFLPATRSSQTFTVNAVVPDAPTIGTATAGDAQATVAFAAPASNGGSAITGYTVTSNPGGFTGTAAVGPITVTGLANGTSYTFTVRASNSAGSGAASAASNSATPVAPQQSTVLRPDRVVLSENSPAVEVSVVANDQIAVPLINSGVLSIATAPTRGTASVQTRGTASVLDDVIRYTPNANSTGIDSLVYRLCFGSFAPCVDSVLTIDVRPLGLTALAFTAGQNAGFRDQALAGLRALSSARFEAHGLVAPIASQVSLDSAESAGSPWGAGASATVIRTLAAGVAARDWRILADARSASGGDLDLYLGIDSNNNGQADASELACSAAMSAGAERCDLALTVPANGNVRYWVLMHAGSIGQVARLELFETPLDVPVDNRTLVATGPGSLAADATFDVRLSWNDPTFLSGQSRGGWLQVRADDNTSVGWVPVRIDRTAGDAAAYALQSGVDYTLALSPATAHERLYIDVPPGAARLDVTTASSSNIDLYLARVDVPVASGATPTIAPAPARNLASLSAVTPSGNESLTVNNPAPGRWYVTPVSASGATADVVARATLSGTGPQLRSGGFFNPARSGNGLFVYPAGSVWAALWYTYLQDGSPTWYYMQGAAPGPSGIWRGSIFRSAWNGSNNRLTMVGEATITPAATNAFTFSYTVDGETGSEAYSNFSGACPDVSGALLDISGHWFDPLRSGSGYSVQSFPNYEFYLVFGYDAQGVPRYLIAERSGFGGTTETLVLEQLRGACPLCLRTENPQRTSVGTLQRRIDGGTLRNISLSAVYVNGVPGAWGANDAVIPLGNLRGCAL